VTFVWSICVLVAALSLLIACFKRQRRFKRAPAVQKRTVRVQGIVSGPGKDRDCVLVLDRSPAPADQPQATTMARAVVFQVRAHGKPVSVRVEDLHATQLLLGWRARLRVGDRVTVDGLPGLAQRPEAGYRQIASSEVIDALRVCTGTPLGWPRLLVINAVLVVASLWALALLCGAWGPPKAHQITAARHDCPRGTQQVTTRYRFGGWRHFCLDSQSRLHGPVHLYHASGTLAEQATMRRGKLHGRWILKQPSGQVRVIEHYTNGLRDGLRVVFVRSGALRSVEGYQGDVLHGSAVYWRNQGYLEAGHHAFGAREGDWLSMGKQPQTSLEPPLDGIPLEPKAESVHGLSRYEQRLWSSTQRSNFQPRLVFARYRNGWKDGPYLAWWAGDYGSHPLVVYGNYRRGDPVARWVLRSKHLLDQLELFAGAGADTSTPVIWRRFMINCAPTLPLSRCEQDARLMRFGTLQNGKRHGWVFDRDDGRESATFYHQGTPCRRREFHRNGSLALDLNHVDGKRISFDKRGRVVSSRFVWPTASPRLCGRR
jgi:hypothetical protein